MSAANLRSILADPEIDPAIKGIINAQIWRLTKQISKEIADKQRAIIEASEPRNRNLFAVSIEFLFRQYKTSEAQRRAAKKSYDKRKNDPVFKAQNLARTKAWLRDNPEAKGKHAKSMQKWQRENPKNFAVASKKYYDKVKGTPAFKAKQAERNKRKRERYHSDPVFRAKIIQHSKDRYAQSVRDFYAEKLQQQGEVS